MLQVAAILQIMFICTNFRTIDLQIDDYFFVNNYRSELKFCFLFLNFI